MTVFFTLILFVGLFTFFRCVTNLTVHLIMKIHGWRKPKYAPSNTKEKVVNP